QDELEAKSKRNLQDQQAAEAAARSKKEEAETEQAKFGKSVPFPPAVEEQKIRMEKPPQPSNEDKELADFIELQKTDPKAAQYSADRLGLAKYKAEQIRVPAS